MQEAGVAVGLEAGCLFLTCCRVFGWVCDVSGLCLLGRDRLWSGKKNGGVLFSARAFLYLCALLCL